VIRAHRNPENNISSACSLLEAMHGMYFESDCLDRHQLCKDAIDFTEHVFSHASNDLESRKDPENNAHVLFDNLVRDPINTVRAVYQQLNLEFSSEYEQILKDHVAEDKKKRESAKKNGESNHGMFQHDPERFGLDKNVFKKEVFQNYIKKYGLNSNKL
jgi:hypothetical protein